jgi:Protein of unknown function (DUF664)
MPTILPGPVRVAHVTLPDSPDLSGAEPPRGADERALLDGWLDHYRLAVVRKCSGLSDEQLAARSCPPSTMSLAGLVRHLTEMERVYAQRLADPGLPLRYVTGDSPDGDFDEVTPQGVRADLVAFTEHWERSREAMAALPLDDRVRWHYLYLIKEYARHLGHADLLRERIDGATGE